MRTDLDDCGVAGGWAADGGCEQHRPAQLLVLVVASSGGVSAQSLRVVKTAQSSPAILFHEPGHLMQEIFVLND
jgi:hypothetical protein